MNVIKDNRNGVSDSKTLPQAKCIKTVKSCWSINKKTLPYKLNFFFFIGGLGATLPYLSAFGINHINMTATNIAAVSGSQHVLYFFTKPGIGFLVDYFNKVKATLVVLTLLQAAFSLLMINIPNVEVPDIWSTHPMLNLKPTSLRNCFSYHNNLEFVYSIYHDNSDIFEDGMSCESDFQNDKKLAIVNCTLRNWLDAGDRIFNESCKNAPRSNVLPSENETLRQNSTTLTTIYISLILNTSDCTNVVCIREKDINVSEVELNSLLFLTRQCYIVPLRSSFRFNANSLNNALLEDVNCDNYRSHRTPSSKSDRLLLLTSYVFNTYQFWLYATCFSLTCICVSSLFTMSDTACHEAISDLGSDYGRTRLWGAFAWGIVAPLAGFLNDYTGSYLSSWCLMAVMCSLQMWNLTKMNIVKPDFSQNVIKDMKTVFRSLEFIAFEIGVFMNGVLTGIIWYYLTMFFLSIGGNKFIIGLAHTIQCFGGEAPFMFCSNWMIQKIGHFNIVTLALFAHGVRFLLYSYIHNPWIVLPVEILHGFTFGSFYSAMTSYAKLNAKPGAEATTQSILCTTYEAVGAGFGCIVFGVCFDRLGGHLAFFYAAFFSMFTAAINVLFTILLHYRKGELNVTAKDSERY